jgi:Glycosyltransferase family 28 C-terminal domain/Monogalactosyldiacylglycerol (MGDG) synthase
VTIAQNVNETTPTVDFVFFDAGGGHRSAALALKAVVESEGYGWDVRLVNLQEVLDPLDIFRKITRVRLQDLYNLMLAKGWTLGSRYTLPLMQRVIRMYHRPSVKLLTEFWRERRPTMVVSLIPNLNRALFESLQRAMPGTPMVTVLTDLADYPPHFWMEKQQQYFICGTHRAVEQALGMGHPKSHVFRVSGMILRPSFYQRQAGDRAEERRRLGLDPNLPTGLVLFGGHGSNVMLSIAKCLGNCSCDLQLILICGRNTRLKQRLERLRTRNKLVIDGFTKEIPYYMHLSDFFIGKPGPGSISEALKMQLPVIVECNAWTLPQERFNAEWVRENGVGIVLDSFRNIDRAVSELLSGKRLGGMRRAMACIENQALYEVPAILAQILASHWRVETLRAGD